MCGSVSEGSGTLGGLEGAAGWSMKKQENQLSFSIVI
jgi:hypothetical protein